MNDQRKFPLKCCSTPIYWWIYVIKKPSISLCPYTPAHWDYDFHSKRNLQWSINMPCSPMWSKPWWNLYAHQQFFAKEHLKNMCLRFFLSLIIHNSQVYDLRFIFFLQSKPLIFSLSWRSRQKKTLCLDWHDELHNHLNAGSTCEDPMRCLYAWKWSPIAIRIVWYGTPIQRVQWAYCTFKVHLQSKSNFNDTEHHHKIGRIEIWMKLGNF
jgi:hypothetical protein